MSVTAAALRELHRIHQQLAELRDRLERGPKQVRAREANVAQLEARLAEARERAKQTQMAVDRKQLDLKVGRAKDRRSAREAQRRSSNREYQALLEQIAAAEMAGSVLSDEILEGHGKDRSARPARSKKRKRISPPASRNWKRRARPSSSRPPRFAPTSRGSKPSLSQAEKALPADLKADYQRVVRSKGADSLAAVDDGVCTGCGQQITLNMQNELKLSKLVFCKACGRLLYLPASRAVRTGSRERLGLPWRSPLDIRVVRPSIL